MTKVNKNLILCLIFIFSLACASLIMYTHAWADDDDFDFGESDSDDLGSDDGFGSDDSSMISEENTEKPSVYFDDNPKNDSLHKNPFEELVQKPKPVHHIPVPTIRTTNAAPQKVVIPPLNIKVSAIIASGKKKLVLLTFDGKFMSMFEGDSVPNKFKLTEINDDSITVYEQQRQSRRTIKVNQ